MSTARTGGKRDGAGRVSAGVLLFLESGQGRNEGVWLFLRRELFDFGGKVALLRDNPSATVQVLSFLPNTRIEK